MQPTQFGIVEANKSSQKPKLDLCVSKVKEKKRKKERKGGRKKERTSQSDRRAASAAL